MAVRIYALARELGLDSKELLDYCQMAGIEVKSSALASLTEEERARVLAVMKDQKSAASARAGAGAAAVVAAPIRRTDYVPASGTAPKAPIAEIAASPKAPALVPAPSAPQALDGERKVARKRDTPRPRVAAAPPSLRPPGTAPPKPAEPAPQKPDLRLPPDAIRAGRKPLEEHIRRHEEKKRAERVGEAREPEERPSFSGPAVRAGPVAGREERKRRRGHRAQERRRQRDETTELLDEEEEPVRAASSRRRHAGPSEATAGTMTLPRRARAQLEGPLTVRSISEAIGVPVRDLLGHLLKTGITGLPNQNASLDEETAQLLAMEFGVPLEIKRPRDLEEELLEELRTGDPEEVLVPRPPVATFLGHVDHGKTSLLDAIRKSNVVAGEAGGITQHIGAYQVVHDSHKVTFLDTPGHEAFTAMRARGANVTDIAVLVVAADDGVMPQTEEAISHARAAGVPIVVALNKVDLPGANVHRVLQQLAGHELMQPDWGGDTEIIQTSATTGRGVQDLLEVLTTLGELRNLRANPQARGCGVCLESSLSDERGVLATLLVQRGTLAVGEAVWCGDAAGRVKAMFDDQQRPIEAAVPSCPVVVTGFDVAPAAGERFYVVDDLSEARSLAERRQLQVRHQVLGPRAHMTLETFFQRRKQEEVRELNLILKADMRGSMEALRQELNKLVHPEVRVKLLHQGIGAVNESDVRLADASDAVILTFQVGVEERAHSLAEEGGVQIRRYDIIYELTEDVRKALEGLIAPQQREVQTGRANVLQTFRISRLGTVAGCRVTNGTIERSNQIRVRRGGQVLAQHAIASLRREKDDVREVREGMECGIRLAGFDDYQAGDELEAFRIEEVKRTL